MWTALKEDFSHADKITIFCAVISALWGIFVIYSAGAGREGAGFDFALRQTIWIIVSVIAMLLVMIIGCDKFLDGAYPLYGLMLLLLLLTDLFAPKVKGAQSWLGFGGLRFQPSEFAKIAIILMLSKFLSRYPPRDFKTFLASLGVIALPVLLVLIQPDAGSALVYLAISFGMLIAAGTPLRFLFGLIIPGFCALPLIYFFALKDYQKMRILVFLDPMRDPLGAGYNVIQSRIAVGSGGLLGKGFMSGTQSSLKFLPEPHTDFIFSVFSEEFGFLGCMILLFLFSVLLLRLIAVGIYANKIRFKILITGVAAWIWFQMFESIGMSIGIMPVTGLPLPFMSYGGSSMLAVFIALGLAASVPAASTEINN